MAYKVTKKFLNYLKSFLQNIRVTFCSKNGFYANKLVN